jgi:hypothetical protein
MARSERPAAKEKGAIPLRRRHSRRRRASPLGPQTPMRRSLLVTLALTVTGIVIATRSLVVVAPVSPRREEHGVGLP